jgi:S-sulfosulfanyl-L-cysteine sulfohydrolase
MITRREFLQVAGALAALPGSARPLGRAAAQQAIGQEDLLRFAAKGQLTLLHVADSHAQLKPLYYREPSLNLGVGEAKGKIPHLTGQDFLDAFAMPARSLEAYMLTAADFEALAGTYGRVGGMDRLATLVSAIRAERGADRVLLLEGGDALQGSYTALKSEGADMVSVLQALKVDAITGHWEFTLGEHRIKEIFGTLERKGSSGLNLLAGNVRDTDMAEPVFRGWRMFERGGVKVAVIGQAFPYTRIANPRWLVPNWSFGIREDAIRKAVGLARTLGAQVVVLLSHNGFDVDRKLARRVHGIDVILTAHTHDVLPQPLKVGRTLLVASGSHGKFLSRLDLEVADGRVTDFSYALLPVLSDAIAPDPAMAALIGGIRAPHEAMLSTELARNHGLLYRRDSFAGTFDDVICDALLAARDAEIALSPGFRWGASLAPNQPITWEDVYNMTAITYPAVYRLSLTGETIKAVLEDVADNLFNPDPYYQQGGDMVRVGGLAYTINVDAPIGGRIGNLTVLRTATPLEPSRKYAVAGWGSVNENVQGPRIWDLVAGYLQTQREVTPRPRQAVKIVRAGG